MAVPVALYPPFALREPRRRRTLRYQGMRRQGGALRRRYSLFSLLRAGLQPVAHLRPQALFGAAAHDQPHVAGVEKDEVLVLAADELHRRFGLATEDEVVLLAREVQDGTFYVREIYAPAS